MAAVGIGVAENDDATHVCGRVRVGVDLLNRPLTLLRKARTPFFAIVHVAPDNVEPHEQGFLVHKREVFGSTGLNQEYECQQQL